jgi:hypothetical protein
MNGSGWKGLTPTFDLSFKIKGKKYANSAFVTNIVRVTIYTKLSNMLRGRDFSITIEFDL